MFFKRLELVGFKSFATKTTVEFLPGVTVVVGPNGCGKSNILDSIKWVLGTQSARSMRGKSMQDVIFAGSASFKPLGVAQVTITIDNSRRTLDIDYDEVQITRRLFRTGESEYLLNKVPCRLRDIHDLLLGTGAGMMAYSILEQGKVDQIINAKPEERRYIFEEAAGISKYKARKLEALRKLERTAEDLKRLEDLISEVQRQVNSLKRQASKAERYKELSAELRQAEMELLVLRSAALNSQLTELHEQIAKLQDRIGELQARFARQSAAEQDRRGQADAVEIKLSDETNALFNTSNRIKEIEHQAQRCNDRIKANERRIEQIQGELAQFDQRAEDLLVRKEEVSGRYQQANSERATAQERFTEHEQGYNALRSQVDEKTRLLEQLNRDVNKHREQLSRCENGIRIEETLITRHEETKRETETILQRLDVVIEESGARRADLSDRLSQVKEKIEEAKKNASALQIRHAETHSRIAALGRERDELNRNLHQSQARLATLQELKSNFEGFLQGVRALMKAAGKGEIAGVIGPVVNLIKSARDYEFAIEVALGSQLQDVVVESSAVARSGIEFLISGGHGRVTLLPIDRLNSPALPENLSEILAKEGVLGHAPKLVEHAPSIESVVHAILGRAIIVKDIDTAERLATEFSGFTYVTLAGQMICANGAMVGGTVKASGLLGREREIAELTKAVSEFTSRLEATQTQIAAERAAADSLADEVKSCTSELHEFEVQKASVGKELESVSRHHDDSIQQRRQRDSQLTNLLKDIEIKTQRKADLEIERVEHERLLSETSTRLETEREQIKTQNEEFLAAGQRLAEARSEIVKIRERITHLEENQAAIAREEASLFTNCQARVNEQQHLLDDNEKSEQEIARTKEDLQGFFETRTMLEKALAEDRAEKEQLALGLKQLAHEIEQISRDERVVENELHERQLRQAELLGNLNHLREQAIEKFSRELIEIAGELQQIEKDPTTLAQEVAQLREKIDRMGPVNLAALDEYNEQATRLEFLTKQQLDLVESKTQIESSIAQLDETSKALFHETFESVRKHFIEMFRRLFNGGKADLVIDQQSGDPLLEGGIEIYAQPPGKKLQTLSLMSGGEKAMTAVSLLFGLFLHKPAPFAILDEIDAPLDDANVERFKTVVAEFSATTQFVIITHNKQTMELADAMYGVTMEESGVSKLVSVRFQPAEQEVSSLG